MYGRVEVVAPIVCMTMYIFKDYSKFMMRQLLILGLTYFLVLQNAVAAPPTNQVLTLPPDEPAVQKNESDKSMAVVQDQGLEQTNQTANIEYPTFHLKPSPSFTITGSTVYDFDVEDNSEWLGLHLAPWMEATYRIQLGLDIYDRFGWLQAAYHVLESRTGRRFYWGGGVSAIVDTREDLRPLLKFKNYFAFLVGGLDVQIYRNQSIRFELSAHQSTELTLARGTIGYTVHF